VKKLDGRGVAGAALFGAGTVVVAYFVAHGSLLVFIAVMVGIGVVARAWAIWYRIRHGIPLRRRLRRPDEQS
jgi:hypothetical protein